ncbi:MAG: TPR repeat-containing protein [Promethearchaeota archaeon CR_4]|nr:MAG: TPR repeat-containing protein [Candidatus Lokiarchaeota archaeon CR_4]
MTGERTDKSLIATIQAFGAGKEGESVFQLEPFKRPAFEHLSAGRSLIVLGYSGSDDFDIVPTLRVLQHVQTVIWLQHVPGDGGAEKVYEVDGATIPETPQSDKVDHIMADIWRARNANHVYQVEANTSRLLGTLLDVKPKVSANNFSAMPIKWFAANIRLPSEFEMFAIPNRIFFDFNMYPDAMRCSETLLSLAIKRDAPVWKANALGYIGWINKAQGNYPAGLQRFEAGLQINEQLGNLKGKATNLTSIGEIYRAKQNFKEALKRFEAALQIAEQLGDLARKTTGLNNIGTIYKNKGNYQKALKHYEAALQIDEQSGNLVGKTIRLNNIGEIYRLTRNYPAALQRFEVALQIAEQLGDLSKKATRLNNIASIYAAQRNFPAALRYFEQTSQILNTLGLDDSSDAKTVKENIESVKREMNT